MPELPEVEIVSRGIRRLQGSTVTFVDPSTTKGLLRNSTPDDTCRALTGSILVRVFRVGKWLLLPFNVDSSIVSVDSNDWTLVCHLGMFGWWKVDRTEYIPLSNDLRFQMRFRTISGPAYLSYYDIRSWGKLYLMKYRDALNFLRHVGVDGTVIQEPVLHTLIRRSPVRIVEFLLDQSKVSGIGNIYRSEILSRAGIDPGRLCCDLYDEEIHKLWVAIRTTLSEAIDCRGSSIRDFRDSDGRKGSFQNFMRVYGKSGSRCLCNALVVGTKEFDGRTVFYCPVCQH